MPKILISYRRADSDAIAGRIRDRLAGFYGEDSVFMDIDDIPFGIDFRKHIRDALLRNDVLVVVVGPRWLGNVKGNPPRIRDETDPVRVEVEIALSRGIPVIPLLVHGADMPRESDLPESLKEFAYRNAAPIDTGRDFHQHMDRLIRSISRILQDKTATASSTATEPIKTSAAPLTGDSASKPPPPDEQPSAAPPQEQLAATAKRGAEGDAAAAPVVAGPSISAELPQAVPPPPLVVGAPPELHGENGSASTSGDRAEAAKAPSARPKSAVEAAADKGRLAGASHAWHGALLAAAACVAVIAAIWIAYVLTPGAGSVAPKEQTKEQTKEPTKEPTKESTKERSPEKLSPAQLAALACKPDTKGAFRDDFKSSRPGWDWGPLLRGSKAFYADGQLVLWAPEKGSIGVLYTPLAVKSGAVCAHVKAPHDDQTLATTGAGVIFWAQDGYNYYVAGVHPDGSYGIYRYSGLSASIIVPRTRFESVHRGLGAVNAVAIALNGNRGTLFVNDVKVQDFEGQPPPNGNAIGLWMQSQEDQPNEWRFLDIAVAESR